MRRSGLGFGLGFGFMMDFSPETEDFVTRLDNAVAAHLNLTRRVLRCALLHESPGDDVLNPQAHLHCGFGCWLIEHRAYFEALNARNTRRVESLHETMHDAIRTICTDVLAGRGAQSHHLETFEQSQAKLLILLAKFKTQFLATASRNDPLTGLPLRYGIEVDFLQMQKSCKRNDTLLYVVMIDADHFKRVNDLYGHPVGDIALRHLAQTLKGRVRSNERLYRFGGEEFLLLMEAESAEAAITPVQRILEAVRQSPVPIPHAEPLTLTVTLGLARVDENETMITAIKRADKALYEGKTAGRDRFVFAEDLSPESKPEHKRITKLSTAPF